MNQDDLNNEYIKRSKQVHVHKEEPKILRMINQHLKHQNPDKEDCDQIEIQPSTKLGVVSKREKDSSLNPNLKKGTKTPKAIVRQ